MDFKTQNDYYAKITYPIELKRVKNDLDMT